MVTMHVSTRSAQATSRRTNARRVAKLASVGVLAALAGSLGVALPANALAGCPKYACIWADESFKTDGATNGYIAWNAYIPDLRQWNFNGTSVGGNDAADSGSNHGNWDTIRLYENVSHGGAYRSINPQSEDGNFHTNAGITDWHDKTSSVYFVSEL